MPSVGLRSPSYYRRFVRFLPALALLALDAALLWLPIDRAQAQEADGPTITAGPTATSSAASGDTYRAGEAITGAVTFSDTVTVTKKPRLRLNMATGCDGSGTQEDRC